MDPAKSMRGVLAVSITGTVAGGIRTCAHAVEASNKVQKNASKRVMHKRYHGLLFASRSGLLSHVHAALA
jgi:hypothetical protein